MAIALGGVSFTLPCCGWGTGTIPSTPFPSAWWRWDPEEGGQGGEGSLTPNRSLWHCGGVILEIGRTAVFHPGVCLPCLCLSFPTHPNTFVMQRLTPLPCPHPSILP